jgi:polar amino acid transport system substrate-binding protein
MVAVPIFADGGIRLGLFLPQYSKGENGALIPSGAGLVARELIGALATRLNIGMRIVELPTPPKAIETVNAGACDVLIIGIEPARQALVDFTPPVIQFDYAYLVPAGSEIEQIAEVDRPGVRISVVQGHASYMTLTRVVKQAQIIGTDLPDEAFALLRDGKANVFALPREQIIYYAEMLPGSRILKDGFGVNDVAFAVAKGQSERLSFLSEFVEDAKASGLIQRILDDAELGSRGFNVGPPSASHP